MAAVLEYLTAELLEMGGDVAEKHNRKTIAPKHLNLGVRQDVEFSKVLAYTTVATGGQLVHIEEQLLPVKKVKA